MSNQKKGKKIKLGIDKSQVMMGFLNTILSDLNSARSSGSIRNFAEDAYTQCMNALTNDDSSFSAEFSKLLQQLSVLLKPLTPANLQQATILAKQCIAALNPPQSNIQSA